MMLCSFRLVLAIAACFINNQTFRAIGNVENQFRGLVIQAALYKRKRRTNKIVRLCNVT
jgi:hypothetical protein